MGVGSECHRGERPISQSNLDSGHLPESGRADILSELPACMHVVAEECKQTHSKKEEVCQHTVRKKRCVSTEQQARRCKHS